MAIVGAGLLVLGGLREGLAPPVAILAGLAVVALGVLVAVVARRSSPRVSSLLTAVGASVIAASIGWGAVEVVRFARSSTVTVMVDNRCGVPLTVTGRELSVPARTTREFEAPGVVVEVHRDEAAVVGEASVGNASVALAADASLTIDGERMAVGGSRTIDLAERDRHVVVTCG